MYILLVWNSGMNMKTLGQKFFLYQAISDLLSRSYERSITKIRIYHEFDPLRITQMGNRVSGSCLASDRVNYYSVFANALDANKGVFYIEDENGEVIGRFLMAIDSDMKMMRFHIYKADGIKIDLTSYVHIYIRDMATRGGFELGGDQKKVKNLVCDERYQDGTREII